MLKTLIEILKDAAEGNLSKFVRRQEFSEEVVSMWLLWKSFKGESVLIEMCTYCLHSLGCHLKHCQIWQPLSSNCYKTSVFGCNGIFLTTENTLWNSRKTLSFYIIFTILLPLPSPTHTGSQLPFSLSFLLKPPVPSPYSTTPASCFKEQSRENCCHRDSLFLSLCAQLPCRGCGDYTHFSRAGSAIEPWGPSLWRTARHQFKKCLTLFRASLISPSLWIILISKQLQYFSS